MGVEAGWWPRRRAGDLVAYLDDSEYARLLRAAEPAAAEAGNVILHRGSPSRSLLFVESGAVEVCGDTLGQTIVLATVGPGGVVGEVGFVDGQVRTHDVRAQGACRLRRLTREAFLKLVHDDPPLFAKLAVALAELVAGRFRATVAQLEPVRAFAASLGEPMELEEPTGAGTFEEIDEPLPEQALDLIRQLAQGMNRGAAGA
jgi:monovalent cation:H+ antiporter, CPA1 family